MQDYRYSFNPVTGNLNSRQNYKRSKLESFTYDNLDRLLTVTGPQNLTMTYNANGNISTKSDIGTTAFGYGTSAGPYALTGVTSSTGVIPAVPQAITYTSFESVATIGEGNYNAAFIYNSDNQRAKMNVTQSGSNILTRWYAGSSYMKETAGAVTKEYTYLGGDAYHAPVVAVTQSGTTNYFYLLRDYLGNITHQVNASNAVVAEYSFDAWGRRRNPTDWSYTLTGQPDLFAGRGFTSHEHLPWFNLVNMNGRLYDPAVGRFISPDVTVQAPGNSQSYNRYTYCMNNPLLYVDYNGYTWAGNFFRWVDKNQKQIITTVAQVAVAVAVSAIVVASAGTMAPVALAMLAGAAGGAAGGFVGGVLGTALNGGSFGQCMAAGGMGALIGGVSGAIGGMASAFAPPGAIMGALYGAGTGGMIGGIANQMSGGSFWQGFGMGAVFGGIGGGIGGYKSAQAKGLNPWTGRPLVPTQPKTISIYRAVSTDEYNDISNNGLRPNPDGSGYQEGKLFYKSYQDAVNNTSAYDAAFGQSSTIMKIDVPYSSSQYFNNFHMDGYDVIYINAENLPAVNNGLTIHK